MITVYGCPNTRSLRVTWALEEAGAEYEYVRVNLLKGEGRKPPLIDVNPAGKVPTLVDGDFVLTESLAIVTYVGKKFPGSGLLPEGTPRERARYLQWCTFAVAELEQPLWTIAKHRFALPEDKRIAGIEDTAKWEFERACRVLDKGLGHQQHILGDAFSAADILLAHCLAWARSARVPVECQNLLGYLERCIKRPAAERARDRERPNGSDRPAAAA